MAGPTSAGAAAPSPMPIAPQVQNDPPVAPSETDDPGMEDDSDDAGSNVLCTVLDNGDGTYTLVAGDEDDAGGDALGAAGAAAGGGAPGAMPGSPDDAGTGAPKGQTFSSPGELLKGILDLMNNKSAPDDTQADSDLNAGFTGGSNMKAPPSKPMGM